MNDPRVLKFFFCLSVAIILMITMSGCKDEGSERMPLPDRVCTVVTGTYGCGRGGTCQQCGQWEIGCPKPLELKQERGGQYANGQPYLVCRMKETSNASAISAP